MEITSGGVANNTTINNGWMYTESGGVANDTILNSSAETCIFEDGIMNNTTIYSYGWLYIKLNGTANNTAVYSNGSMYISSGGTHHGTLQIESGAKVSASAGAKIDFTVSERSSEDNYLINDISLIQGAPTYTITVATDQEYGTYKLAQGAGNFSGSITIGTEETAFGSITVNGDDFAYDGAIYSLDNVNGDLTLTVSSSVTPIIDGDLDRNGKADVILVHTKQGYSGAWLTTGKTPAVKWGNLSNVNSGIEIIGTGKIYGSEDDGKDIFYTDGKHIGAWNVVEGKVTGYKTIMNINSTTNVLGLGDFNGDGTTDILLRSTNGDLGFHNCDGSGWQYLKGLGQEWNISAIGDLNGDGLDDVVLQHDAGFAGTFLTQEDGTVKWANLDTLKDGIKIVGTGDFNGDGIDDVLLQKADGWVGAWLVEDGTVTGFMGICKNKNSIEQIADFNGDGIDDLRIRTDKGDIGVLYVKGADTTEWQYFQSVGKEWDTSTSLLA